VSGLPNGIGAKFKIDDFANSRTSVDLAPNALPMLVRFRDVGDPKSVELVDPDHLDASFGPGVKILRAKAEITNEPITAGIEKRLRWLKGRSPDERLFEARGEPVDQIPPERLLTYGDFLE
jgi:hypothetical protein